MLCFRFNTGFTMTVAAEDFEEFCAVDESGELIWTNAVLDDVIHRLEELETEMRVGEVDVLAYEESADGTINLWQDLRDRSVAPRFAVGIVIFHQLLYKHPLSAVHHA